MTEQDLTKGFAFVPANKVPKQERVDGAARLAAYREQQAVARNAASAMIAKGILGGKTLTDNLSYEDRKEAEKTGNRAKALAAPALLEQNQRPALTVTGTETEGYRWWVSAVAIPAAATE